MKFMCCVIHVYTNVSSSSSLSLQKRNDTFRGCLIVKILWIITPSFWRDRHHLEKIHVEKLLKIWSNALTLIGCHLEKCDNFYSFLATDDDMSTLATLAHCSGPHTRILDLFHTQSSLRRKCLKQCVAACKPCVFSHNSLLHVSCFSFACT